MKIECIKERLKTVVIAAEKLAGRNLTLPILSAILFEAKDGMLLIRATNLDIGLEMGMPAKVVSEGKVAVLASVVANFLTSAGDGQNVTMELIGQNLSVVAGNSSALMKTFSAEEYPVIPRVSGDETCVIGSDKFVEGIRSVSFSSAQSDIKPEISSVNIFTEGKELVFVATDSFRLAERRVSMPMPVSCSPILVPHKNIAEAGRIFELAQDDVQIEFNKNQASFSAGGIYFTTRLVGGIFPNYKQIMPTEKKTSATVLKKDLLSALRVSSVFSDKLSQIKMKIAPKDKFFEVAASNQDTGEGTANIDAVLEGEDISLSFNSRYVLDFLAVTQSDSIAISFNGEGRPMVMSPIGDSKFTYLVMPLNK